MNIGRTTTEISDKNVLIYTTIWMQQTLRCPATLYRPEKMCVLYSTILFMCTQSRQHIAFIFFFCFCPFLWNAMFVHSPIIGSQCFIFRLNNSLIPHVRLYLLPPCFPFINESHKNWIFILIKWTSHFASEEQIKSLTQIAYKIANKLLFQSI